MLDKFEEIEIILASKSISPKATKRKNQRKGKRKKTNNPNKKLEKPKKTNRKKSPKPAKGKNILGLLYFLFSLLSDLITIKNEMKENVDDENENEIDSAQNRKNFDLDYENEIENKKKNYKKPKQLSTKFQWNKDHSQSKSNNLDNNNQEK